MDSSSAGVENASMKTHPKKNSSLQLMDTQKTKQNKRKNKQAYKTRNKYEIK